MSGATPKRKFRLDGVFPPLPTPFDKDDNIDFNAWKKNVALWEKIPFKGYVLGGSCSELPYISPEERLALIRETRKLISNDRLIIGGSTCESTKATCELSIAMAKEGADAVLVLPPFYFKSNMSDAVLLDHFTTVANRSPIPVLIYNYVAITGFDLPLSVLTKLAAHPNIVGIKDTDVTKIGGLSVATQNEQFDILEASAGCLLAGILAGSVGSINGLCVVYGEAVCQLYELSMSKQYEKARELQMKLVEPEITIFWKHGVPGLKAAMDILGYYGGPPRKPLHPVTDVARAEIRACLKKSGFFKNL
ncbi:4-hydroxy-2-oxoglutarate aldolase, mitochondrial isoform X2 [Bemisia tabaci]|uniref:4-hydroxy-2-oxoglutarate aldolase, mitochondrial isoform X2 n=1 Tax=Bemisia tabaci TaxID=7038 RepID=UPI003B27E494